MIQPFRALSLAVAVLVLAACGKDPGTAADSQVAATVNGKAIVFRQVTRPIRSGDGETPPQPPNRDAIEALDQMIDQELLAQRAQEMNLDKDPAVINEIEAASHRILAQAYVNRSMRAAEATAEEISRFYHDHPVLFEQRHIYYFQELSANVGREHVDVFRKLVAASGRLDDIAGWLRQNGLPFQRTISIKTTEQLPAPLLPRLTVMQNAQLAVFEGPDSLHIVQLMLAQPVPISLSEAAPAIEKMLLAEKRQAFMRDKARQLREKAEIRYLGPFARNPDEKPPAPEPPGKDESHINKGMTGVL